MRAWLKWPTSAEALPAFPVTVHKRSESVWEQ